MSFLQNTTRSAALRLLSQLDDDDLQVAARAIADRNVNALYQALGPLLNRTPSIDGMAFEPAADRRAEFTDLVGLFASTPLDHAVITMTIREAAYLFDLVRKRGAMNAVEIGRYKGGSTLLMTAAKATEAVLWSIDIGEKEARLAKNARSFDTQLADALAKMDSANVHIMVGDSGSIALDPAPNGPIDLIFFDGDHSLEGLTRDVEHFLPICQPGTDLLFHDAAAFSLFPSHTESVTVYVDSLVARDGFELVTCVDSLAHVRMV